MKTTITHAIPGLVCRASENPAFLCAACLTVLDGLIRCNAGYLAALPSVELPLLVLVVETKDAFAGAMRLKPEVEASELLARLQDALRQFAPPGHYFGVESTNGSPWGFWPALDRCG